MEDEPERSRGHDLRRRWTDQHQVLADEPDGAAQLLIGSPGKEKVGLGADSGNLQCAFGHSLRPTLARATDAVS